MKNLKNEPSKANFFLATTTSLGVKHYFASLRKIPGLELFLLNGVPGTGISALLAELAQGAHAEVEYIADAQAPKRLVGILLYFKKTEQHPQRQVALLDVREPYQFEAFAPGLQEHVIDLHGCVQPTQLQQDAQAIKRHYQNIACLQTRIARYVTSIESLLHDTRRASSHALDLAKLTKYIQNLCARELPRQNRKGQAKYCFLSALTAEGTVCYIDTITKLAKRIFVFHDEYGATSKVLMAQLQQEALQRGYDVIICPCAMSPEEKIDHVFIPALQLAFVTSNVWHPITLTNVKNIHCTRFADAARLKVCRTRVRFNRNAAKELQEQCVSLLVQMATEKEALRALYRPAIQKALVKTQIEKMIKQHALPIDIDDGMIAQE